LRKTKADASGFLIIIILLLLAGGAAAAVYTLRSDPVEEALSLDRVINVLFVFEKDKKPLGSYVLMYYPSSKRAAVFDIPGDLGLIIKRINRVDRIDSIYNSQRISGFEDEIESLLGIEIGFSLLMNFENTGKIIDLLEGVELFIPAHVRIQDGDRLVLLPSGLSRMDGEKASLYLSYENPDEDREMTASRRQRFFMSFLKRLGEKNGSLNNPAAARIFQSLLDTNMRGRTRTRLFNEFAGIDIERTAIQAVRGNLREVSGQTLLLPYFDGNLIKEIVRQTLGGLTRHLEGSLSERVFTVEVLNGTVVNGLAGRTADLLSGFGYDIISTGNADNSNYQKTVIYDRSGYEEEVKSFADIIRCRNIRSEIPLPDDDEMELSLQSFEYRSDFTLILGSDFNGRYVTGN
jgi:anionic cell wall polymer biosynthesis LytR-Cps2A-Psr (LCP) family protein